MTNVPDFRGRVESNKPQDFLHRLAEKIPGYTGYQDRERRRDADKELRMYLARGFRDQYAALQRVQQQMARSRHLESIGEVDRLSGMLQRFIDKLETATQGYAGLFDPVKVDTPQLDQLYTFDAALTDEMQKVKDNIAAVSAAAQQGTGPAPGATAATAPDLPAALSALSATLDELLRTWNHRNEVIMSGQPMPAQDFERFRATVGADSPQPYTNAAALAANAPAPGAGGQGTQGFPAPPPAPQQGAGQPYQPYAGPQQGSGQPSYSGPQPGSGQPTYPAQQPGGGQPYQPYSGPAEGSGQPAAPPPYTPPNMSDANEGATRRIDSPAVPPISGETGKLPPVGNRDAGRPGGPSDVGGPPTGGPSDPGYGGSGQ
jgi:hypothetical protein